MPKKTFACAEQVGAILITQAKDNQAALKKQIQHGCAIQPPLDCIVEALDKEHGRIESRTYEIFDALPMLKKWHWPSIRRVIRVTRYRHVYNDQRASESTTSSYYVTNGLLSAKSCAQHIRAHWDIENKVHYIKDVAFQEDKTTKRCNPSIYSTCIDFALNIMKMNACKNIRTELHKNTMDFLGLYKRLSKFIQ